jgi:hypothetical protein
MEGGPRARAKSDPLCELQEQLAEAHLKLEQTLAENGELREQLERLEAAPPPPTHGAADLAAIKKQLVSARAELEELRGQQDETLKAATAEGDKVRNELAALHLQLQELLPRGGVGEWKVAGKRGSGSKPAGQGASAGEGGGGRTAGDCVAALGERMRKQEEQRERDQKQLRRSSIMVFGYSGQDSGKSLATRMLPHLQEAAPGLQERDVRAWRKGRQGEQPKEGAPVCVTLPMTIRAAVLKQQGIVARSMGAGVRIDLDLTIMQLQERRRQQPLRARLWEMGIAPYFTGTVLWGRNRKTNERKLAVEWVKAGSVAAGPNTKQQPAPQAGSNSSTERQNRTVSKGSRDSVAKGNGGKNK